MNPCPEFEIMLESYADLAPSEKAQVETHLTCAWRILP
jgi:hypothetical protein